MGGESDEWVKNVLKNAVNRNMKVINLLEVLGDSVKTEEIVEGMQEDGHDHGHSHDNSSQRMTSGIAPSRISPVRGSPCTPIC